MKRLLIIALFLMVCSFNMPSASAEQTYIRNVFGVRDGLSDGYVKAVFCDSRGIIWIGTQFGVEWYDGYKLRHVQIPGRSNVNVLLNSIFEDGDNIVVGTINGLLVIDRTGVAKQLIPIPLSRQLWRTPDGKLWIASLSKGLRSIDPGNYKVTDYPVHGKFITADSDGNLFHLKYDGTICRLVDNATREEPFIKVSREVSKIFISGDRLFSFSDNESKVYDIKSGALLKEGLAGIKELSESADGTMWAATYAGLYKLDGQLELQAVVDESGERLLDRRNYSSVCAGKDGGVWAGTATGLIHLSPNSWAIKRVNTPFKGWVNNMVVDEDGNLWGASSKGEVFRYDSKTGVVETVRTDNNQFSVSALYADGPYIWLSNSNIEDRPVRIDRKTLKEVKFNDCPWIVTNFKKDSKGLLWMGAAIFSGHISDCGFVLTSKSHYATITEDGSGYIWTGVKTQGITRHNPDGSETHFDSEQGNFPSRGLQRLECADDGTVWALTEGDGLFRYDSKSNSFVLDDRLPAEMFRRMVDMHLTKSGVFLISSQAGLLCFRPSDGTWSLLRKKGIFDSSFGNHNVCSDNDRLYFGSKGSFFVLDSKQLLSATTDDSILFTSFSVIQPTVGRAPSFKLKDDIDRLSEIVLPHDCNSFRIYMSDLDFSNLKTTRLVYKLDGYSDDWKMVKNGVVDFLDLPSGSYKFLVRIVGPDGSFAGDGRKLKISVKKPLWASPLAIAGYVAFLIVLIVLIVRRSVRKSEEKMAAEAALKEAESEKELYASKVEFLSGIAHEIKTPLSLVQLPVESLARRCADTKDPYIKEDIETLKRNSEALGHLVEDFLDFQKLEHSGYKLEIAERDVWSLTGAISERFRSMFDKRKLSFTMKMPSGPCHAQIDTRIFEKILTNLFSNAAKYSSTYVKCSLSTKSGEFVIKVENDGVVVPVGMRDKIFSAFVRYEDGRHFVEGTGIGLYSSRKFAELLGGSLRMDDDASVNRFILSLPLVQQTSKPESSGLLPEPAPAAELVSPLRYRHSLMVVEDNDELSRLIERAFGCEYDVVRASDGFEALEMMDAGRIPSIVVSDVMMPNMDGLELCRRIKENKKYSSIPVVMLTAKSGTDVQVQAFGTLADAYLQKPFSMDVLQALVKSQLENRHIVASQLASGRPVDPSEAKSKSPDNQLLIKVQEYISANLANNHLKMDDLAAYCSVSLSSLQKRMKQIAGMSPAEYILQFRMKEAVRLLSDPSLPVSEISILLGFTSHSYFSSCFKKEYGVTPVQWREKQSK